jgi:hypothetical protein
VCGIAEYGDQPQFDENYNGYYPEAMGYDEGTDYQYADGDDYDGDY